MIIPLPLQVRCVRGGYTYDPSFGTLDGDETGVDSITFTIEKTASILFDDVSATFGDPNIFLNPSANDSPGAITYSVLTSPTVISIISGNETSIDTVGSSIVSATIASSGGYLSKTVTFTVTVNKATSTFNVDDPFEVDYSPGGTFTLVATPTSSNTSSFTFTVPDTNVISIAGNTATISAAGTKTITVTQPGDANHLPLTKTFTPVVRKAPTTFDVIDPIVVDYTPSGTFTLIATPTSSNTSSFTFSVPDTSVISISGNIATISAAGTTTVSVTQPGDANHLPLTKTFTVVVNKDLTHTISISNEIVTCNDSPLFLNPTSVSSGAFTFSVLDGDSVSLTGSKVTIDKAGTSTITIDQAATTNYGPTTTLMKITVDPLPPNLSSPNYTVRYGDPAFSIINSVTTSSSGTLIFQRGSWRNFEIDANSGVVTSTSAGTGFITIVQPSDGCYGSDVVFPSLTVLKGSCTLTSVNVTKTYGDLNFVLDNVTTSSSGNYTFTSNPPAIVSINNTTSNTTINRAGTAYSFCNHLQMVIMNRVLPPFQLLY